MKKKFCLMLALLLLASSMISCSDSGENSDTPATSDPTASAEETVAAETEPETEFVPEVEDMEGASLTLLNYTPASFSWADTRIFATETTGEILNDALYMREQKVEELYNCTLEELASGNVPTDFSNGVLAGDTPFDASLMFDANITNVLMNGSLLSWNALTDLDLSKEWWDTAATAQYNFGGIQAAVTGAYSLYNYSTRHCYVYNKQIYNDIQPDTAIYGDTLYDLVREGKWTVDRMYELGGMAVLDVNGDGEISHKDDIVGIAGSVTRHYSALLAGAEIRYIDRDENDTLYFNIINNEPALNVVSKFVHLGDGNYTYTSGTNDIGGFDSTIFPNNRALFLAAYVGEAAQLRDMETDIGIVPAPKFDEAQENYSSLVEGGALTVLPTTLNTEKYHDVAVLLDAFAYYSNKESIPAYIDNILMAKTARDQDSVEMLELVFATSFYDLGTGVWSADTKNQFTQNVFLPKSDTAASLCARIDKLVTKNLERFTTSLAELIP